MTDPRTALRTTLARWLRVRAQVRASANRIAAHEYALQREAMRSDDPDMLCLLAQLRAQRASVETLGAELDGRLAALQTAIEAQATQYESMLVSGATSRSQTPG